MPFYEFWLNPRNLHLNSPLWVTSFAQLKPLERRTAFLKSEIQWDVRLAEHLASYRFGCLEPLVLRYRYRLRLYRGTRYALNAVENLESTIRKTFQISMKEIILSALCIMVKLKAVHKSKINKICCNYKLIFILICIKKFI